MQTTKNRAGRANASVTDNRPCKTIRPLPDGAHAAGTSLRPALPARDAGMFAVFVRRGPWGYLHAHRPEVAAAHAAIDSFGIKRVPVFCQGFNGQVAVNERQIVLAAEITPETVDFSRLEPMVCSMRAELENIDARLPEVVLADAGFWNEEHLDQVTGAHGIPVLIPPDSHTRKTARPGWTGGRYAFMRRVLSTDLGAELYRKRKQTVEPVFGHTNHNRKYSHFRRRGRAAVRSEWRLVMATHNVCKLYQHHLAAPGP